MRRIVLIAHNLRSAHNVGSLLRTADGLGLETVYLTGYTPHPSYPGDTRLPHLATKESRAIQKTALGAEQTVDWHYHTDPFAVIQELKQEGYQICALEQAKDSVNLFGYHPQEPVALILGNEVTGVEPEILAQCATILEIPMLGQKESFNVVQAAAMALCHLRFDMFTQV